jgi:hypothetical protein
VNDVVWLLLVVVIVFAALAVPRFGKVVLILLAVLIGLAAVGGLVLYRMDQQEKRERAIAKSRIPFDEIDLVNLALQPSYGTGSYTLVGRVRNKSARYTLSELRLQLTIRDCLTPGACEIVGESDERIYADVPAGQARDLSEYVHFSGLQKARGEHAWDYRLTETLGR